MRKDDWWGKSALVDLHECDKGIIQNPFAIKQFAIALCKELDMTRVGPTAVKRFGTGKLCGYSMIQFITTSSITAHFDEHKRRAFIDVFSCKPYQTATIATFCKRYFGAKYARMQVRARF